MDRLLQFVCDNSELYQFSVVLKRFVEQQDQVPDTNYLESLQLVLQALEKSQHLSEDLVTKVLREVCWPIVYSRSDESQRKKLHLCYDIVALCCSVHPTKILSEVHEKSLEILRRYISEKSATDENAHDVSVTLDLIGNLVKPEAFESGEAHLSTSLSLAYRHAALGRDCQKRLLISLGTSQYFLIRILELCLTWKVKVKNYY